MHPISKFRESLLRSVSHLSAADHEAILNGFMRHGLADAGNGAEIQAAADATGKGREEMRQMLTLTPRMSAARSKQHEVLLNQVQAMCRRYGDYELQLDEKVDMTQLDAAIRTKGTASLDDRYRLKSALAALNLAV